MKEFYRTFAWSIFFVLWSWCLLLGFFYLVYIGELKTGADGVWAVLSDWLYTLYDGCQSILSWVYGFFMG